MRRYTLVGRYLHPSTGNDDLGARVGTFQPVALRPGAGALAAELVAPAHVTRLVAVGLSLHAACHLIHHVSNTCFWSETASTASSPSSSSSHSSSSSSCFSSASSSFSSSSSTSHHMMWRVFISVRHSAAVVIGRSPGDSAAAAPAMWRYRWPFVSRAASPAVVAAAGGARVRAGAYTRPLLT